MTATTLGLLRGGDGDAAALITPGGPVLTRAELADAAHSGSQAIRSAGVGPSDRVAIAIPGGMEAATALLAVSGAAVAVPMNPLLRPQDLASALVRTRATAVVTAAATPTFEPPAGVLHIVMDSATSGVWSANGERLQGIPVQDPAPDSAAILLHTSGTTGRPKGVPLAHRNLAASAGNIASWFALDESDRSLTVMPLFHIHGIVAGLLAPLSAGCAVVIPPRFDPIRFFGWLELCRPTWYSAVPTIHRMVLARAPGSAPCRLRFVRSSSAPLPRRVMDGLESLFGAPAVDTLGMTEASHQVAANPLPPGTRKPGSVGVAAGAEIQITDSPATAADRGGEIAVRGPGVFGGYQDEPPLADDGWFRTGDLGRIDSEGYVFVSGRIKEMINRGGEKVAPGEVEEVLLDHPAVAEAVVFAVRHPWLGEEVAAAVVLGPGASAHEKDLIAHARGALPAFKVPRTVVITDAIPKGETGKVQRTAMAARLGLEPPA